MLYMEGCYDPTIDVFKHESFEFTGAAREADPQHYLERFDYAYL